MVGTIDTIFMFSIVQAKCNASTRPQPINPHNNKLLSGRFNPRQITEVISSNSFVTGVSINMSSVPIISGFC